MSTLKTFAVIACAALPAIVCAQPSPATQPWNPKSAAAYLDQRMAWWMDWPSAQRDHQTFCVSCHTSGPYAVARPALQKTLAEHATPALEQRFVDNVTKRVRLWKEVEPFYPTKKETDPKTVESRGTESIFNALVLVRQSEPSAKLSPDARLALDNMWGEQIKSGDLAGAWPWLQFHNSPWEGDSQFYGTTLAALALGSAPREYRELPEVQAGIKLLSEYLNREEPSQKLIDRVTLLWASAKLPGLLTHEKQQAIVNEVFSKQLPDGGFSLSNFIADWKRRDNTPLDPHSDGYATGMVAVALEQTGVTRADQHLQRALAWLASNQQPDGNWLAWSLNKQRDPASDPAKFMGDAATAYAALALAGGQ